MATDNEVRLPLIVGVTLLVALGGAFGAFWSIMQTQFTAARERDDVFKQLIDRRIDQNIANVASLFKLFQDQIDRRENDALRRDQDAVKRADTIQAELDRRRNEFVTTREFIEFGKLIDTMRNQIRVLESTRPTAGELKAVTEANGNQITKIEDRVKSLEDNLRRIIPAPTMIPGAVPYPSQPK